MSSKLALLFDTGRMQFLDLSLNWNGEIEDEGEFDIDLSSSISFPTEGARREQGEDVDRPFSTETSLGDGSNLVYLHQSGLLLYKCSSSCLLALILDSACKVVGSFELLPHTITATMIGNENEGSPLRGPYTHWTELGIVERQSSFFYRVACVAKTKSNQEKLLYLEFNQNSVNITRVTQWPSPMGAGLSTSFEGIASYSGPFLREGKEENGQINENGYFCERIYLAALTSNGSLLIYGEHIAEEAVRNSKKRYPISPMVSSKRRRALSDSALSSGRKSIQNEDETLNYDQVIKKRQPKFPLTMFETLINVSDRKELRYGGDGISNESDPKRKLEIANTEFLTSPSREGCTLTVFFQNKGSSKATDETLEDRPPKSSTLAIVAVRILLGSTTKECLPKELIVMGRPIAVTKRMKRWYNIPLTDEEIVLGVRNGFVSIGIGASFELNKNPPLVDAIEVYAQERRKMQHLFPPLLGKGDLVSSNESVVSLFPDREASRNTLDLSILALTHIYYLVEKSFDRSSEDSLQTLLRLIQVTALDSNGQKDVREKVIELLKGIDKNESSRQMLIDEGTILGISDMLKYIDFNDCQITSLGKCKLINSGNPLKEILSVLNDCMSTAISIVENRPDNYKESIGKLISSGSIKSSLALQCKHAIDHLIPYMNVSGTVSNLIRLALFETMVSENCFETPSEFAGLEVVSDILKCPDGKVVKECCSVLVNFFKDVSSTRPNSGVEGENPRDSAYQCDGCSIFPITGKRFTLEEGHDIDLCGTCFKSGCDFARGKSNTPVLINGKELRLADREMTCSEIRQMRPVAIANASKIIEKVRQATIPSKETTEESHDADEDDAALQFALKMSLETHNETKDGDSKEDKIKKIRAKIFGKILGDVVNSFSIDDNSNQLKQPIPVIDLLLSLILGCKKSNDRLVLSEKMGDAFCKEIEVLIHSCENGNITSVSKKKGRLSLVICLRSLVCLITRKELSLSLDKDETQRLEEEPSPSTVSLGSPFSMSSKSRDKTDPRFVCDVHQVPAVRRR
jgi:hypothetical protein